MLRGVGGISDVPSHSLKLFAGVFAQTKRQNIVCFYSHRYAFFIRDNSHQELHSSVRTNNVETCLRLLSKGADPNYFHRVSDLRPRVVS